MKTPTWTHNVAREFRMLSALASTDTPVPAVYHYCDDEAILDGEFFLMNFLGFQDLTYQNQLVITINAFDLQLG